MLDYSLDDELDEFGPLYSIMQSHVTEISSNTLFENNTLFSWENLEKALYF